MVTGAARRIGAVTARRLHGAGYRVAVHYRSSESDARGVVDTMNREREGSAMLVRGDLALVDTATAVIDDVVARFERLDLLVNNASIYEPSGIESADPEQWDRIMSTNLRSPYLLSTRRCRPCARRAGQS